MKYSKKEIKHAISQVWPKLSNYLQLNLTWKEFLNYNKKKYKNFKGFKLLKSPLPPCWYAGLVTEKNESYIYLYYWKKFKGNFKHHICHELIHILRQSIQGKLKQVNLVSYLLDEALADVVSTKIFRERERELKSKGLYNLIDVCALEQIIYELNDKEIRKLSLMPKSENELKKLTFMVLKWISSKEYKNNINKVWKAKIKEKVYY